MKACAPRDADVFCLTRSLWTLFLTPKRTRRSRAPESPPCVSTRARGGRAVAVLMAVSDSPGAFAKGSFLCSSPLNVFVIFLSFFSFLSLDCLNQI